MLTTLSIRQLAVIDALSIELGTGLCVFTGETGAGKSILVDALGLALGDRADAAVVRTGCERAEVTAAFDVAGLPALARQLEERGLEAGGECVLHRQVLADGGSRAWCNGTPVTAQTLREIGEHLVDIHGQSSHHSLLRRPVQRDLLDEFAGLLPLRARVAGAHADWQRLTAELRTLTDPNLDGNAERELLEYQLQELEAAVPDGGALAEIESRHQKLANATRIQSACERGREALTADEAGAADRIGDLERELQPLAAIVAELAQAVELLTSARVQLEEADHLLRRLAESLDCDAGELHKIERRLAELHELARKHRVKIEELPARTQVLRERLETLATREARIETLSAECAAALHAYRKLAMELSSKRRTAALSMSSEITDQMQTLGMAKGRFEIHLSGDPETAEPAEAGNDVIEFVVSVNPDQAARALAKVASGGELSRISLAIQVATAGHSGVPVLVYDEVDAGIGGATADIVGHRLADIAAHRQVLCVTHLPQVARYGARHFVVGKEIRDASTRTTVTALPEEERVVEIARMLGGIEITAKTIEHARELLQNLNAAGDKTPRRKGTKAHRDR